MQNKKAVSLIVLVITIIVMIILAGVIILSLNNSGIIDKAQEAVDKTNEAQLKQILQVGWAEAYADGARTEEDLKSGVDAVIEKNNLDVSDYDIVVTTRGVTITRKGITTGWRQEGLTVTNGTQVLTIGDIVNYDETNGGTIKVPEDVTWQLLGVNEQGKLMLLSSEGIGTEVAENDVRILNEQCQVYGNGKSAIEIRSITLDDVDKITGYDKTTYGKGQLHEYGNSVTYSATNDETPIYPAYTSTNGLSGNLTDQHYGFYYYSGGTRCEADLAGATEDNPILITTLTSTGYEYDAAQIATIDTSSKAYSMLFGTEKHYLLASSNVITFSSKAIWGLQYVSGSKVFCYPGYWSSEMFIAGAGGRIRAVVTLSSDVQLSGSSDTGWSY